MTVLEFPNPNQSKGVPRIRVERGNLFADIVLDRQSVPNSFYVIVQEHGSPSVLRLDRYESFEDANRAANYALWLLDREAA